MALICSKLLGCCNQSDLLAVSDKDGAFAGGDKDGAVLTVIDVEVGGDIEDKILAIFAVFDIVLLLFDRIYLLDFEGLILIDESIIVRIVFLLYCLWLQNICLEGWLLFNNYLRFMFENRDYLVYFLAFNL